jgi:hypothetical protein
MMSFSFLAWLPELDTYLAQNGSGMRRNLSIEECAALMQGWLDNSSRSHKGYKGVPSYTQGELEQLLGFAQSAALIVISPNSTLSFRHELIAEYFVSEHLRRLDGNPQTGISFMNEVIHDIGTWSEPVSLWAGMIDQPMDLARRLASLSQQYPNEAYNALALSLVCVGVMWTPPKSQRKENIVLPYDIQNLFKTFVQDKHKREGLATILTRSAKEGGVEVYRSLLPLFIEEQIPEIDELLLILDRHVVPQLLLDYLRDAVDAAMQNVQKKLIHILGRFGADIVPLTEAMLQPEAGSRIELHIALLDVLGRTKSSNAIRPLIMRLSDENKDIVKASVNALVRLGPTLVLDTVTGELKSHRPPGLINRIHWAGLERRSSNGVDRKSKAWLAQENLSDKEKGHATSTLAASSGIVRARGTDCETDSESQIVRVSAKAALQTAG